MMAELNNITQTTPVPTDSGDDSFCPFCAILWIFLKRFFPACIGILVTGAVCLIVGCVLFQCYRRKSRNQFRTCAQARNNPGENREANDRPVPLGIQHLPLPETPVIQRQKVIRPDVESKHYSILNIDGPKPHHLTDPEVDYIHPVSLDDHSVPIWNTDSVYDNLIGDGWFEHARTSNAYEQPITDNTYVELRTSPPTAAQPKQHQIRPVKKDNFKSAPVSDGTPTGSRGSGLPVIVPVFVTNVKHKPIDRELQNQMQTFQSQRSQTQGQATVFSDGTDDRLKPKQTDFLDQRTLPGIADDRQPDLANLLQERTLPKMTGHDEGGMKMNVSDDVTSSQPDDEDRYASWPVNEPKSHVQDDDSNEVEGVTIHKNRNSSIVFVRLSENDVENTDIAKNENESIISPGDSTERDGSSEGNKNVFETEPKRDSDEENNETKSDSDEENNETKNDSDEENNETKNDLNEENIENKSDSDKENNETKSDSEEENNKTKSDSEEENNKTKSDSEEDNNETKSDSEEENNETKASPSISSI